MSDINELIKIDKQYWLFKQKWFTCRNDCLLFMFLWQESDSLWWDAFATEFFEEDATLTLSFCLEDGPKRYSKSRTIQSPYYLNTELINTRSVVLAS